MKVSCDITIVNFCFYNGKNYGNIPKTMALWYTMKKHGTIPKNMDLWFTKKEKNICFYTENNETLIHYGMHYGTFKKKP